MTEIQNSLKGKFIVLDGPDGCGKSTQAGLLVQWLKEQGVATRRFRDPGDTAIGEKIRDILLNPEHSAMSTRTELLLYMAARSQLWNERIGPALHENQCVVLDRWLSSTCAYQGYAGGFGMDRVIKIATDCLERVWPDLTIILDVDIKTSSKRLSRELDRMEAKGDGYHQKVREGFLQLADKRDNFIVVDATQDIHNIHKNVIKSVRNLLATDFSDFSD
ncbi:MAG: dTMP kinase [Sedimentisphaerales bacterium]|nr:dTMP kinase [Sedimentisphaerales bacterium]